MNDSAEADWRGAEPPASALAELLGCPLPDEGETIEVRGQRLEMRAGILRSQLAPSAAQGQTADAFGFKWQRRDSYDAPAARARARSWLEQRYGSAAAMDWLWAARRSPILLDAGCGSGMSAVELFGERLRGLRYVGVDISESVDIAATRFAELGLEGEFLQGDLLALPFAEESVDAIFSEGVLHHTDAPRRALERLTRLLRPAGRFLFYIYRRKGPIREFTDDYVRDRLQQMEPADAWAALLPLTRLGKALGELGVEIEVPEEIGLLEIPAGRIDLQRLFYWHVCKAFYRPELSLEEMNHINFDWYAPPNAFRQSPEEIRSWCHEAGLEIERERVEAAGVTVIARRRAVVPPPS